MSELLVAAIEHLVEQETIGPGGIGRTQDEDVDLVLDHPARVARRLVEIDDHLVLRRGGIELALGHALDPHIGADLAEGMPVGERLGRVYPDLGDAGLGGAEGWRAERDCKRDRFAKHGVPPDNSWTVGCRYSASARPPPSMGKMPKGRRPAQAAEALAGTPFSLNRPCSSPAWNISRMMSQPPTNSPLT